MDEANLHADVVGAIDARERNAVLRALEDEVFDCVVIGGGMTGAGIAWQGAARGLRVALIEAADFGEGTSSRSTKLIHGGLRYLKQLDIGLVKESLSEREKLLHLAPNLVHSAPFLIPIYSGWKGRLHRVSGFLVRYRQRRNARRQFDFRREITS